MNGNTIQQFKRDGRPKGTLLACIISALFAILPAGMPDCYALPLPRLQASHARGGAPLDSAISPLFPCSPLVDDPYGVCTHITRPWMDYPMRDRELEVNRSVGISWVRSDFDFATAFGSTRDFHPKVFDDVLASCRAHNQGFLPILTWMKKMPWDDSHYDIYVDSLAQRYKGVITHWEMMNEVNLIGETDSLPVRYVKALRVASERIHQVDPQNKVLLSGLGEVKDDFLEDLCRMGAMRWVDIMNFHSYFRPEELLQCFAKIRQLMARYGWEKPVWLTECGMHTSEERQSASGFYHEFLPAALRRIGIEEGKACVGYLADRCTGYVTLSAEQASTYLTPVADKARAVTLDELPALPVKKVPVLLAATDEYFPKQYFPALVDYVKRGGTIVLAGGMPFYYDACLPSNTWFDRQEMGTSLYDQLHMSPVRDWRDAATDEELTETPSVVKRQYLAGSTYQWEISEKSPARYLTGDNLRQGDSLLSLVTAGTEHRQETVAGIYRLNSDLKGNIVFQTRMYAHPLPDKEAEQARRVARVYLLALAHGVERVFWYNLRSRETDPYEPEDCFGLIHADFTEKPSLQAYRTLTRMLPPGSTRPQLKIEANVFTATWTRPDGSHVTALWSPYVPVRWRQFQHGRLSVYSHMGEELRFTGKYMELTDAVKYVVEQAGK